MIFEIVATALAAIAAGLSYASYCGARKFYSRSQQAAVSVGSNVEIARERALAASGYATTAAVTLTNILAEKENIATATRNAKTLKETAVVEKKSAKCYACDRDVNSFTLKEDGRAVCKYCSDRGK